jgi:preprotein translocase subunit SecA
MFTTALARVVGSRNQRLLKRLGRAVDSINGLEDGLVALSDGHLAAKTAELRERLNGGSRVEDLLAEAFAVVRETARRTVDMRHFDVQLIGGMVLYDGKIAEMRTGEGKTLVATLPVYLASIEGKRVHVVTVNDYLAQRDAEWMGPIYEFLGLSVGTVVSGQDPVAKREAYACDVVYGTNNEFGFDYLRDNMAFSGEDRAQGPLDFAIVDEVDSILIDEARTPLIISGPAEDSTDLYVRIDRVVPQLTRQQVEDGPGDFNVDEKLRQVFLTDEGFEHAEALLLAEGLLPEDTSLYDVGNITLMHHLYAALRAHSLFQKNVDYIVRDDSIIIIDEFTGRMMPGRRWSEGLHQAVEAKERVTIQHENQTLASITFQNLFRLYGKLAGMTGTADTEAAEFQQIYDLEVVVIPTNQPMIRNDLPDLVYRTQSEKFDAIVDGIKACSAQSQPVLVGTASIETSEALSEHLKSEAIHHEVLNAKNHEREAQIIAQAGRPSAVTIATNMAGRGTDIVLGGNLEMELAALPEPTDEIVSEIRAAWQKSHQHVIAAGGLHVLGTERHESRRVDNQLRGRCGRQGDPGSSRFYLSMQDNLMRIFGSDRVSGLMERLGMEEGEAIEHPWVTKAIQNSQKKVEGRNFDMRKQLLEYDDVANEQRKVVYAERDLLMTLDDVSEHVATMRHEVVGEVIDQYVPRESLEEQWNIEGLETHLESQFGQRLALTQWLSSDDTLYEERLRERIGSEIINAYHLKERRAGAAVVRHLEKAVMLQVLDEKWKDHLGHMDHLRQGIGLRGYAQKNPRQEYKREAFEMFTAMLDQVKRDVVSILSKVEIQTEAEVNQIEAEHRASGSSRIEFVHDEIEQPVAEVQESVTGRPNNSPQASDSAKPYVRAVPKVGRNQPCPCGSGKKYKHCHG